MKRGDNAKLQYEESINDVVIRCQEDFLDFNMSNDCLDHVFRKFLNSFDKYKDLWKDIQIIFVIPNGQAQIERGFRVSNKITIEKLVSDSLCAPRLV